MLLVRIFSKLNRKALQNDRRICSDLIHQTQAISKTILN